MYLVKKIEQTSLFLISLVCISSQFILTTPALAKAKPLCSDFFLKESGADKKLSQKIKPKREIDFEVLGMSLKGTEFGPLKNGELINQFAYWAQKEVPGIRVVFSEALLEMAGGKAAYDYSTNILFIPPIDVHSKVLISTSTLHEMVHSRSALTLREGKDLVFAGKAQNSDPNLAQYSYGSRFDVNEVPANLFNAVRFAQMLGPALKLAVKSDSLTAFTDAQDLRENIQTYLTRVQVMLYTIGTALQAPAASSKNVKLKADEEFNGPLDIEFNEFTNDTARVLLRAKLSDTQLERLKQFTKTAVPLLGELIKQSSDLSVSAGDSPESKKINLEAFSSRVLEFFDLFKKQFPVDAGTMDFPDWQQSSVQ
ncbi:hypothetical protein K2X05_05740 [bacterium]|nr:hypothetical protein [bacterium]